MASNADLTRAVAELAAHVERLGQDVRVLRDSSLGVVPYAGLSGSGPSSATRGRAGPGSMAPGSGALGRGRTPPEEGEGAAPGNDDGWGASPMRGHAAPGGASRGRGHMPPVQEGYSAPMQRGWPRPDASGGWDWGEEDVHDGDGGNGGEGGDGGHGGYGGDGPAEMHGQDAWGWGEEYVVRVSESGDSPVRHVGGGDNRFPFRPASWVSGPRNHPMGGWDAFRRVDAAEYERQRNAFVVCGRWLTVDNGTVLIWGRRDGRGGGTADDYAWCQVSGPPIPLGGFVREQGQREEAETAAWRDCFRQ